MTTTDDLRAGAVLFTDLVGFTEYNESVGDRAALDVLDAQTAMATTVVDAHRGARIVKELGDGLMLWFAEPADAVAGASALLDAIDEARDGGAFPLPVRMGLHFGTVLPRGDDVVGQTVNIAARLSDLAGPGELLVSEAAIDAIDDGPPPPVCAVGPIRVKGLREPIWVHCVERTGEPA
ncbi:MAG: adenylate/guanylate cyclase domain-containing protein [Actinomycetota bacterium]